MSLDPNGQVLITSLMMAPAASTTCPGALQVNLYNAFGQPLPNPLTCAQEGLTVTAVVRHIGTGNSCSGTITIQDWLPPQLSCPDKFIFCTQDTDPYTVGMPDMTDNCTASGSLTTAYSDNTTTLGCGSYQNGIPVLKRIDRTWLVTDLSGNQNDCVQKIWIKHIGLQDVSFPQNLDNIAKPSLRCGQDAGNLSLTGQPTVEGVPVDNSPFCELAIAYSDQILPVCPPAGYVVLRQWTAVDFCTGSSTNKTQIIKVEDKTPPKLTVPADMTVGTDGFDCTGTVALQAPVATDSCSSVTTTATWDFGNGFGPFYQVPIGDHIVTYKATDACSNTSTKTMRVSVRDQTAPQAVCSGNLQVSLSANGLGYINAQTINASSFDNCGPVFLNISRDGVQYGPQVQISCADQSAPLTLYLRVTDTEGLENFCQSTVTVQDLIKPVLTCPPAITLTCLQDHENLALTGQASATDNCSLQQLTFSEIVNLNGCQIGTVQRTWLATDAVGNTKSCIQQIAKTGLPPYTVTFPADKVVSNCVSSASLAPISTGEPVITGQWCFPPNITYQDELVSNNVPQPVCFRILRHWRVIDFCTYDPNGGSAGLWEQTQIIDVRDQQAPVLQLPPSVQVAAGNGCSAQVNMADAFADDCSTVLISNNSPYANSSGINASGNYPLGHHNVVFTATDNCGNFTQQTLTIDVLDQTPPTVACPQGVVIPLGLTGVSTINPPQFVSSYADNCSLAAEIVLQAQPDTLTCLHVGPQVILFTAQDAAGNTSTCQSTVVVEDALNVCGGTSAFYEISGSVKMANNLPAPNVLIFLTAPNFRDSVLTDTTGYYVFEQGPAGADYTIQPFYNNNWLNGLSTFDLVLISKHILNLEPLDSPWKIMAADANRSGSVTTFDIVQFRKVLLGIFDAVPGNQSWRFVPESYVFPFPSNPFAEAVPDKILIQALSETQTGQNFIGLKIGDVNQSVNPTQN
ncbi:MAG: HYR domain-containing protein [Saprospiraceae bacterium]|nr:HYR domain-containing protein [Saprospiraceae bacterium]